jgi:hypothetical protein
MSYNRIYGKGTTPEQALLYSKINEIGHNTKTPFLKKTRVKYLEYKNINELETQLVLSSNLDTLDREMTTSESNARKKLQEYYGDELVNIYEIYNNPQSTIALCFLISKCKDYKLYKFLY